MNGENSEDLEEDGAMRWKEFEYLDDQVEGYLTTRNTWLGFKFVGSTEHQGFAVSILRQLTLLILTDIGIFLESIAMINILQIVRKKPIE